MNSITRSQIDEPNIGADVFAALVADAVEHECRLVAALQGGWEEGGR